MERDKKIPMVIDVLACTQYGFLKMPNLLVEALMMIKLNGREYLVFLAVLRITLGFHKRLDWLSCTQITALTGIDANNVSKVKRRLLHRRLLISVGKKLGINTQLAEWQHHDGTSFDVTRLASFKWVNTRQEQGQIQPENGLILATKEVEVDPHKRHIQKKEKHLLKNKQQPNSTSLVLPEFVEQGLWSRFVEHRQVMHAPLSEYAQQLLLNKLTELHQQGQNIEAVIEQSVMNNYKGFFPVANQRDKQVDKGFAQQRTRRNAEVFAKFVNRGKEPCYDRS